jgi:hypothetical protein
VAEAGLAVEATLVAAAILVVTPVAVSAQYRLSPVAVHALAEEVSADTLAHRNLFTVALACPPSGRTRSLAQTLDR